MSDRLLVETSDAGVRTITLHRPEKRNAIDTPMVEALLNALRGSELDSTVRVVVLRGSGKDFCAGADLAELLASADQSPAENAAQAAQLGEIFITIREGAKPVVAVVHGRALAGGCGLATACDMVLAHSGASFGYPEVQRGFVPAMVMAMLRRCTGEKAAFDLVATGRIVSSEEGQRLGLVTRVLDAARFDADVDGVVGSLAASSPTALALIKKQLYQLEGRSFRDGIALGAEINAVARSTPAFREAVGQFLSK